MQQVGGGVGSERPAMVGAQGFTGGGSGVRSFKGRTKNHKACGLWDRVEGKYYKLQENANESRTEKIMKMEQMEKV